MRIIYLILIIMICAIVPVSSSLSQEEMEESGILIGKITYIDLTNSIVKVIDEEKRSMTLFIEKELAVIWRENEGAGLLDLKNGQMVELEYYKDGERFLESVLRKIK